MDYRVFVVNPGSTSTKLSLYEHGEIRVTEEVFHDSADLLKYPTINDQLDFRMEVAADFLKRNRIDLHGIDAIAARGGGCYSVESGVYRINDQLIEDTAMARGGLYHASMLGVQMARRFAQIYGGEIFMMDPPIVDELCDEARLTGVEGIHRCAVSHALNLHEAARRYARQIGRKYEQLDLIVTHIDGGVSVTAHHMGKQIDGNDAGGGEGPFTPTRMGTMAVTDVNEYLKTHTHEQLRDLCSQAGGFTSYFGTSNSDRIHAMVEAGDPKACAVWKAFLYQIGKSIGSMAVVLKGHVDGIVLTGGLLRFPDVEQSIRESCGWIAPVASFPGEFEQAALASGAVRVLSGEEAKTYPGRPVWDGFDWEK